MNILTIIQIIVSILLIAGIILQRSGDGIEGALGGGMNTESMRGTRRGFESFIFQATVVLGVAFAALSVMQIVL